MIEFLYEKFIYNINNFIIIFMWRVIRYY